VSQPHPSPHDLVRRHLQRLLQRARLRAAVHGATALLGAGGGVVLAAALILGAVEPERTVRWVVALLIALALGTGVAFLLWRPLRRLRCARDLARGLEARGTHANTLNAAEEALRRPDRWSDDDPAAQELVRRLLTRAAGVLERVDLARDLPLRRPGAARLLAGAVVVAVGLAAGLAPQTLSRGLAALVLPGADTGTAGRVGLFLAPGPDHVIAGEDATLAALDFGLDGAAAVCEVRVGSGLWRPLSAAVSAPAVDEGGAPFVRWQTLLTDVREDVSYRFRRGARVTETDDIVVWHPPLLGDLAALVRPPAYTRLPATTLPRLPGLCEVPAGSRLELNGRANSELAAAGMTTDAGDTLPLRVRGRDVSGVLTVTAPLRMRIGLTDRRGLVSCDGLEYEVAVVPDEPPVASLSRAEDDGQLPLAAPLSLLLAARDDYGVATLDLLVRRGGDDAWQRVGDGEADTRLGPLRARIQVLAAPDAQEVRRLVTLDASTLTLVAGDVLELCAEARDNRAPGPAGVGRSAILRLVVPSSSELLAEQAQEEASKRADLAETRRRSADLAQDLERLRRELLRNPMPDWNKQQELQAALQRQQDLQQELSRLAEDMRRNLESLASNQLTSEELLAKMDEIAELLQEATSPELQAMLDQLRADLAQRSPEELAQAVQELSKEQQDMLRRMDTALAMLQDLAREQELEGLTSMLAQMMREQQELAEAAQESSSPTEEQKPGDESKPSEPSEPSKPKQATPDAEEVARRQEALAKEMASLQQKMEEALAGLKEQQAQQPDGKPSPPTEQMKEALEQALEQMKDDQTAQDMQKAGEKMSQGQPSQASQQMQQSLAEMAGLYSVLLRTQAAMQMAMQQTRAASLRGLASDLLALSERQERIQISLPAQIRDVRTEPLARQQHQVLQSTIVVRDGLAKAASAAPQEIMRLLGKVDDLLNLLGSAVDDLEAGNGGSARASTRESLAEMNRIVIGLLTQAQTAGGGGGGGSNPMPQLGQKLREMASEQAGLNAMADQLRRQQGISEQLRSQMQRLQQGQQGLSGRARELAEQEQRLEAEDGPRILGDMRDLAQEMERVADDLGGGLVTDETMRRQEHILSRLLDAQNSARERDFAKRRESRSAEQVYSEQGGLDGATPLDDEAAARRQQTVEKAPPAYRDLVRRYFRDVLELQRQREGGRP
jgi:hypothetical protein